MPVSAITPNFVSPNLNKNYSENSAKLNCGNPIKQDNILADYNYGTSLINLNKLSFKGVDNAVKMSLTKKISAVFKSLDSNDILLIGKDFSEAKNCWIDIKNKFIGTKKDIYFVKDNRVSSNIAIRKNKGNQGYILNLDGKPFWIDYKADKKITLLKKGDKSIIRETDRVYGGETEFSFTINPKIEESIDDIPNDLVKKFDAKTFQDDEMNSISVEKLEPNVIQSHSKKNEVTFADVGGQDKAISLLKRDLINPVKNPEAFPGGVEHGIIAYGPPGTGKTLLARALANELNINFVRIDAPAIKEKWVGGPDETIRRIIESERKKQTPTLIFIDEVDSIAKDRGSHQGGMHNNVVDQLLTIATQIKDNNEPVYLYMATNRIDLLDTALTRPGRAGVHIFVGPPDSVDGCEKIYSIHAKKLINDLKISDKVNIKNLANELFNLKATGAEIEQIVVNTRAEAYERCGIIEKMNNNSFNKTDLDAVKIEPEDFSSAINKLLSQREKEKEYTKIAKQEHLKELEEEIRLRLKISKEIEDAELRSREQSIKKMATIGYKYTQ